MIYDRKAALDEIAAIITDARKGFDAKGNAKVAADILEAVARHTIPPKKESGMLPGAAHTALFSEFSQAASGYDVQTIVSAALNIALQATYVAHPNRKAAMDAIEEKITKFRAALFDLYTNAGKKGGSLEPVTHILELPRIDANKKLWSP